MSTVSHHQSVTKASTEALHLCSSAVVPISLIFQGSSSFLYSYWQTRELQESTQAHPSQILAYGCARQHPGVGTGSTTPWSSVVWMTASYHLTRPAIVAPLTAPTGPASSSAVLNPLGTRSSLLSSWKLRGQNPIAVHPPFLGTVRGKPTLFLFVWVCWVWKIG